MINICNFPTQVVAVDDNESFLQSLELVIDRNNNTYNSFSNPFEAIKYLEQVLNDLNFLKDAISINIDEYDLLSVDLNINNLYKEIYSAERFSRVSLLITDFDMPGLTGLDLCQKLNNCYIYRILLTGIADESTAINAFNNGLIEQFMRKSLSIVDSLENLITKSQEEYFNYISKNYSDLFNSNNKSLDILKNHTFIDLFNRIIKEENITEHYLLDSLGSFLMLNNSGEVSALYLTNLKQHEEIYNFAKHEDCPNDILEDLKKNNKTLWFYQTHTKDPIDWNQYLMPLNHIDLENQVLYYSYTKKVPFVDKESVISFDQYKKQLKIY